MNLKIINTELSLAGIEEVPEEYTSPESVIFFYYGKRDWIVFNLGHPDSDIYLEAAKLYLGFSNLKKKRVHEELADSPLLLSIKVLDRIERIRKRRMRAYEN